MRAFKAVIAMLFVCLFGACTEGSGVEESVSEVSDAQMGQGTLYDPACYNRNPLTVWDFLRAVGQVFPAGDGRPCSGFLFGAATKGGFVTDGRCAPKRGEPMPTVVLGRERSECVSTNPNASVVPGQGYEVVRLGGEMHFQIGDQRHSVAVLELAGQPAATWGALEIQFGLQPIGDRMDLLQAAYVNGAATRKADTYHKCLVYGHEPGGRGAPLYYKHKCSTAGSYGDPAIFEESVGGAFISHGWRWVKGVHVQSSNVPGEASLAVSVDAIRPILLPYL